MSLLCNVMTPPNDYSLTFPGAMAFSKTTLGSTTLSKISLRTQHLILIGKTPHKTIMQCYYTECRYVECHCDEFRGAFSAQKVFLKVVYMKQHIFDIVTEYRG